MKIPTIHTYFLPLITLLLTACILPISTTTQPPAAGGLPVEQAIQEVLDEATQAIKMQDPEALERLIDPDANSNWVYRYTKSAHSPTNSDESNGQSVNVGEISIEIQRVMITNQWALAAIIISAQDPEEDTLHQTYTYRTLRNREGVGWQLTSPVPQAWGQQQELTLDCLKLTYYAFDEPYVQAAVPKIEGAYRLFEEDFAIPFCEKNGPMALGIVPNILWDNVEGEKIQSPLTFEFPLSFAATPEDFLLGFVTDTLAHMLLKSAYDTYGQEMSRTQLSHSVIQWEVDAATGRNRQQDILVQLSKEEPIPLKFLLDPTETIYTEGSGQPRDLVGYFIKETYGRPSFGPFVQAVFETESADELTRAAFGLPFEVVEEAWRAWLFLSAPAKPEGSSDWQTYREADDLFTVAHPPEWAVHEAGSTQSNRIWQFNHPENLQTTITIVKYLTRIPDDMPLEEWIEQIENYEFEFERIHAEAITIEDADAYFIHDRLIEVEREVYITYLRCVGTVWSLHLIGSSENLEALETLYQEMLNTFRPTCLF